MTLQPEDSRPNRDPQFPPIEEPQVFDPIAYAGYQREREEPVLMRNPYVLAGLAVAAAIVMAVVVVVMFGGGGGTASGNDGNGSNGNNSGVAVDPLTPQAGRGVTARVIAAATVREGPSSDFQEIAPLRANQDVEVAGKNANGSWFQIYYPAGSQLKGWVPGSSLRLPDGSAETLAVVVATPIPRPTVAQPSPTPEPAATAAPTHTPVPTAQPGPDLALSIANVCQPGTQLIVTVRNAGTSPVQNRQIRITVAAQSGVQGVSDTVVNLEPNASVNISTNQMILPPRMLARIDVLGSPPDIRPDNNAAECVGTVPGPPAPPGPGGGIVTPRP